MTDPPAVAALDNPGAIAATDSDTNWSDGYSEVPFTPGGGAAGNQWEDWGRVMYYAIAPPIGSIEDVLRRTPIDVSIDKAEVSILWSLMIEQIGCSAARYNLELRFLHAESRIINEVIQSVGDIDEDQAFALNPADWLEHGSAFYRLPVTLKDCSERMLAIHQRIKDLHGLIEIAKMGGVYYDVCDLIDWFATNPDRRSTNSPSHVLPHFGQVLFGILGLSAQNTQWAHVEAVTSRQIAPRFGGSFEENEKTRHRNPAADAGGGGGGASNAPR